MDFTELFSGKYTDITLFCPREKAPAISKLLFLFTHSIAIKYKKNRATIHGLCMGPHGDTVKLNWEKVIWR